ncbi:hypothetical protein C8R44DRAFT_887060 [Mycena epipterygia]|nr:hypothetical protein C8R44DRAFT_887060 [Mycena epipterygia]
MLCLLCLPPPARPPAPPLPRLLLLPVVLHPTLRRTSALAVPSRPFPPFPAARLPPAHCPPAARPLPAPPRVSLLRCGYSSPARRCCTASFTTTLPPTVRSPAARPAPFAPPDIATPQRVAAACPCPLRLFTAPNRGLSPPPLCARPPSSPTCPSPAARTAPFCAPAYSLPSSISIPSSPAFSVFVIPTTFTSHLLGFFARNLLSLFIT